MCKLIQFNISVKNQGKKAALYYNRRHTFLFLTKFGQTN